MGQKETAYEIAWAHYEREECSRGTVTTLQEQIEEAITQAIADAIEQAIASERAHARDIIVSHTTGACATVQKPDESLMDYLCRIRAAMLIALK